MNYTQEHRTYQHLVAVGDTHGRNKALAYHLMPEVPEGDAIAVLHVGDFGVGFKSFIGEYDDLHHLNLKLAKNNVHLYVIRGNHDNPMYFNGDALETRNCKDFTNIEFIADHTLLSLNINGVIKFIYCYGGAISVDRVNREPTKSYWWNEIVTELTQEELDEIPSKLDIVLTHTRPLGVFPIGKDEIEGWLSRDKCLQHDLDVEALRINKVFDAINKKNECYTHYYGHFHTSNTEFIEGRKHQCLAINEVIEIR